MDAAAIQFVPGAEVDLPDVEDMAHSAVQEALACGVGHDVFHRWMRAVMDKTIAALRAAPAPAAVAVPATWVLVEELIQSECNKTRVHQKYMGKVMPDDVCDRFLRLRDERVPALRSKVYAALAAVHQAQDVQRDAALLAAAKAFYNGTVADTAVRITAPTAEARDRVKALGENLRAAIAAKTAQEMR